MYKPKFYVLYYYATWLLIFGKGKTCLYIKGLYYSLYESSVHITLEWKGFNDVSDYVKKLKGVTQVVQAKILAMKSQNVANFYGSYSNGHNEKT